jgi:hypothetical protein
MSTPPPGEREAPKQDEVPLPEPTRLAHEAGELYHEWQSFEACWEDLRVPAEQRGENWRDHCAIRDKWHAKFAEFNAALIAYGNARARSATERAAQVCREHASDMRALHKDDADAEELAAAILADAGIKGEKG